MSSFITRPGLQALSTPYIVEHSRTAAFYVPTHPGAIQALLDATLNAALDPLARRFTPLLDAMMLTCIHYPDVHAEQAGTPPADCWGTFSYEECAAFLLLHDAKGEGPGLCWHVPMLILNQGIPLILGREVYGMPKVFGRLDLIRLQADDWITNPSGTLKVAAEGFPQCGSNVPVTRVDVAEATLKGLHVTLPFNVLPALWDPLDLAGLIGQIVRPAVLSQIAFDFFKALISVGLPGIFLKQFPAGDGCKTSVYCQLLSAGFTPTALHALAYVQADVRIFNPDSYPLAATFGLTPGATIDTFGVFADIDWNLPPPVVL